MDQVSSGAASRFGGYASIVLPPDAKSDIRKERA